MKINIRTIGFAFIIIICVIAVIMAVWSFFPQSVHAPGNTIDTPTVMSEENELLAQNFKTIFLNKLDYQGYNVNTLGVNKKDSTQDLIYTIYTRKQIVDNRYDIDLNIPIVNISNNTSVEKFNQTIQSVFVDKANDIIMNATNNTVYSIDYMAYVNTNILSLVIRSTLKEGNNPQRVMIQTYNYNLSTNEEIKLNQILDIKGLVATNVEKQIQNKVQAANQEAENLKHLGYNVYTRDLSSDIYKLEKTENYMLGPDNKLYIIYPYGNANYTDAMDVIVF